MVNGGGAMEIVMLQKFSAFWQAYPEGGVVQELAEVIHGQYVVRVLLQNRGQTITSALAIAPDLDLAQTQAQEKALQLLPSLLPGPAVPRQEVPASPSAPSPPPEEPRHGLAPRSPMAQPPESAPEPEPTPGDAPSPLLALSPPEVEPAPPPTSPGEINPTPDPSPHQGFSEGSAPPVPPETPEPEPSPDPIAVEILEGPEAILQALNATSIEMKRLQWTVEQGRDYLVETFGKRSRQLLSPQELGEFLTYLQGLSPTDEPG